MKKYASDNKKSKHHSSLLFTVPALSLALYILRIISGYDTSGGVIFIGYAVNYPLILFAEYMIVTLLFIPFVIKSKNADETRLCILPLMLISSLGMMRIDADTMITSREADHSPAIMFIILTATLVIMAFSGHTATGAIGTFLGTALFSAFGLTFSPFISAAAFLLGNKNEKEKKISVIINLVFSVAAAVYGIIKIESVDFSFSKKYIPVLFLVAVLSVFFAAEKEYGYIPLAVLPVFPLVAGIFFGSFPTELFTLSASVAPTVMLLGTVSLKETDKKITGYAQKLVHNPILYIIAAVFILHTAHPIFAAPGFFRDTYI